MVASVTNGALLQCTMGMAPSSLTVLPTSMVSVGGLPSATIMDHKPAVNLKPFGMCISLSNPTVAAATAAALGVLTPMPCVPNTTTPWVPGSPTVLLGSQPALNQTSKCACNWGGVISVVTAMGDPAQVP